jgi:hypothetical protein
MAQQTAKKKYLNKPNDDVVRHDLGIKVIRGAIVIQEQKKIPNHMLDEEQTQEESGEAHDDLLADRGSQKPGSAIHGKSKKSRKILEKNCWKSNMRFQLVTLSPMNLRIEIMLPRRPKMQPIPTITG